MSFRFPDFFVVGAPRCGTTALCRYLAKHPAICFSRPKEPHYFKRLARWNTVDARPAPLTPALRSQVWASIADDTERLGALLGRDLCHWIAEKPHPSPNPTRRLVTHCNLRARRPSRHPVVCGRKTEL